MKQYSTYVGLDLSNRSSSYHMLDSHGDMIREGIVNTNPDALRAAFGDCPCAIFAIEVCGVSRWVEEELRSMGHEVVVANARKLKAISANTRKSDKRDAVLLARLLRTDPSLLFPIQHRSRRAQVDLTSLRSRDTLVSSRSKLVTTVRSLLRSFAIVVKQCDAQTFHKHARAALTPELEPALNPLVDTIETLTQRIREMDRHIARTADTHYPIAGLLQSVGGVGPITSMAFVLTIDNPHRFAKSRDVPVYIGLVSRRNQSGQHDPQLGIAKDGDAFLRRLLVSCAYHLMRCGEDSALKDWALKLKARGGRAAKKRAAVALARKLACLMHSMWINGEVFTPYPIRNKAAKAA